MQIYLILWWCIDCKLKTDCQWLITSALHDVVSVGREQHVLQPFALAAVSVRAFRTVAHVRVHSKIVFCMVFGNDFNTMSALLGHNRSACRKNSILVKVCFHAKRGLL